jgi:hypothetical protein
MSRIILVIVVIIEDVECGGGGSGGDCCGESPHDTGIAPVSQITSFSTTWGVL